MFKRLLIALALLVPAIALAQTPAKPAAPAAKPAATAEKAAAPKVLIKTSLGDITVELYADKAPKTVDNFLQYVDAGFFKGTIFHRIIPGFMIQGGGFTPDLVQKQTRAPIANEGKSCMSNARGTIAMARTMDPNSASAQFFINTVDNQRLDFVSEQGPATWGYCAFGKVTSGLDIVDKIQTVPTGEKGPFKSDVPVTPVMIESITRAN